MSRVPTNQWIPIATNNVNELTMTETTWNEQQEYEKQDMPYTLIVTLNDN